MTAAQQSGTGLGSVLGGLLRPAGLRVPRHRSTTRHLASIYPCQTEPGLGAEGVLLGYDVLAGGAAFCFDPFAMYTNGMLENPNMLIIGEPGFGKSACVKCYLYRALGALGAPGPPGTPTEGGRWAAICDPKGEYRPLAEALGLQTVRLYPGGPDRVNPLDAGPAPRSGAGWDENLTELEMRRTAMTDALLSVLLKRPLTPVEEAASPRPSRNSPGPNQPCGTPTLVDVAALLGEPSEDMAAEIGIGVDRLAEECRLARLGLGRLLSRDLRGMFDGPSTVRIDWSGRGVVLDVSFVHHDADALTVVMIPATSWLQALMSDERPGAPRKLQVIEECWAMLRTERVAFYLQACWKLCRRYGVANVAVAHRLSDLSAQSDDGTATAKVSQRPVGRHPNPGGVPPSAGRTGRGEGTPRPVQVATDLLPNLRRGEAVWRIGDHDAVVTHAISPTEAEICNTDQALAV